MDTGGTFLEVMQDDHSPPSTAEVKTGGGMQTDVLRGFTQS
jgi:hypothetical protein